MSFQRKVREVAARLVIELAHEWNRPDPFQPERYIDGLLHDITSRGFEPKDRGLLFTGLNRLKMAKVLQKIDDIIADDEVGQNPKVLFALGEFVVFKTRGTFDTQTAAKAHNILTRVLGSINDMELDNAKKYLYTEELRVHQASLGRILSLPHGEPAATNGSI